MSLTPETLPRHELVGLDVEVVSASNPDAVGISGETVAETTKTIGIERDRRGGENGERPVSRVPKSGAAFAFAVPADESSRDAGEGGATGTVTVTVDGERLVARPARRTEQTGDSQWR